LFLIQRKRRIWIPRSQRFGGRAVAEVVQRKNTWG